MGDVIPFPAPVAPPANHSDVTWRGCWHCGLVLFDDEIASEGPAAAGLCTDCRTIIEHQPDIPAGLKPSCEYMRRAVRPDDLARMAAAIVDGGVETAEASAEQWAVEHLDDEQQRHTYIGDVRGRCARELAALCHRDGQRLGEQLGWS